jgi:hypothetical protein
MARLGLSSRAKTNLNLVIEVRMSAFCFYTAWATSRPSTVLRQLS